MADFTPITINTQEEMDNLFRARIDRVEKKYSDYVAPDALAAMKSDYEKQISDVKAQLDSATGSSAKVAEEYEAKLAELNKAIADKDAAITNFELKNSKVAVALEVGLPYELAERLCGSTAEELKADAEKLVAMMAPKNVPPLRNPDHPDVDPDVAKVEARYKTNPWYKK